LPDINNLLSAGAGWTAALATAAIISPQITGIGRMKPKTSRFYLNPTPQRLALNLSNDGMSQRAFRNIAHSNT
jgi:hypothetical protein